MKRLLTAGLLALPLLVLGQQSAFAWCNSCNGGCLNLQSCLRLKICYSGFLKAWCEPFGPCCTGPCGGPGGGGGCATCGGGGYGGPVGYAGGGDGGGGYCNNNDCSGYAPGPWYVYWPYTNPYVLSAPQEYPGWVYDMHFQTPAPIYPFWPTVPTAVAATPAPADPSASLAVGLAPASYYPNYWQGR